MKIKDIGEQGLLKKLKSFCPHDIIGDDAAVLSIDPQQQLVVTTDVLVDKIHFSQTTTPPDSVGWRAIAANLSDLAAMGASPVGIVIGLSLPGNLPVDWVEQLYQGMSNLLREYNTPIVGGDICRSEVTTVSITALGQVDPDHIIKRSTAQPGDVIITTGYHGMSRGGLELLLNPTVASNLDRDIQNRLIKAHQYPIPRLDLIPHLWEIMDTHTITGMDSSDGLGDAVIQICAMSGVGAQIQLSCLPCVSIISQWFSSEQALNWVLYGGEDFELVLCLAEKTAKKLVEIIGQEAKIIGKIVEEKSVILIDGDQQQALNLTKGFQHFS
ncbi:thiamine-phosphate kinase [Crocosphaera chwakensis]|uniref:Thiamine-monophosphate kinase n=1 Tax=Crocosphaera chwakensis CCY0110 TaxID=391612 RepID=A3IR88_9CHRO|nr:thiamine-phosphate kinase [Crocosphaera chwakensis]EAZ91078.1 thiamine monophosphate kinase [Crocosphaera chwakensis CCY0110]